MAQSVGYESVTAFGNTFHGTLLFRLFTVGRNALGAFSKSRYGVRDALVSE